MLRIRRTILSIAGSLLFFATVAGSETKDPYANAPPYLRPLSARVRVRPIVTVGQQLPLTRGNPGATYRFPGIPDGLGVYAIEPDSLHWARASKEWHWPEPPGSRDSTHSRKPRHVRSELVLLVNHEMDGGDGPPTGALPSGARVSEITLDWVRPRFIPQPFSMPRLMPIAGRCAIDRVFAGDVPARVDPVEHPFAKFCSAFLADSLVGFDRPILLFGEEARGKDTFDGRGGCALALFEGNAYTLPRLGRAEWENIVAAPFTEDLTVLFGLEDGPADGDGLHSQLYMYVQTKDRNSEDPLVRNGLQGGQVHVLAAEDSARASEGALKAHGDSMQARWVPLPWDQDDVGFDQAAKAAGGIGFVRIEDGACDPSQPGVLYFVTTGAKKTVNPNGRMYRLRFDPAEPLRGATLTLLLDGSEGVVRPDNIAVNRHGQMAIQEDPGGTLKELGLDRDSSIWMYEIATGRLARIATMDRATAVRHALKASHDNSIDPHSNVQGSWESSGIIDAEAWLGRGAWICTVQAHGLRIAPAAETVEGGQVLQINYR